MILNSPIVSFFLIFFFSMLLISLTKEVNGVYGLFEKGKGLIYIVNVISTVLYASIMGVMDSRLQITNHWPRVAYRFVLLSIVPFILAMIDQSIIPLSLALMNYTIFYFMFEVIYNEERGNNPYSVGTTAWNDRIVNWINLHTVLGRIFPTWYIAVKISLLLITQFLVMKYYF